MKSRQGVALVASLLVLVAVMLVGAGMLFLSRMNLAVAENTRSSALAEAQANAGLEAALLVLETYHEQYGVFPSEDDFEDDPAVADVYLMPTIFLPAGKLVAYAAADVRYEHAAAAPSYTLSVDGRTVTKGLFESETLVANTAQMPKLRGLVAEGRVTVKGNSTYTDAVVHGNLGYELGKSTFIECSKRDADNTCIDDPDDKLVGEDMPISAAEGRSPRCGVSNDTGCPNLIPPQTAYVGYLERRDAAVQAADVRKASPSRMGFHSSSNEIRCDVVFQVSFLTNLLSSVTSALGPGRTICIEGGGVNFPSGTSLPNVTIVADGAITFESKGSNTTSLNGTTLISRTAGVNLGAKSHVTDATIFSQQSLDLSGTQNEFLGNTTIASAGDIKIGGRTKAPDDDSPLSIGLVLLAEGNIEANGGVGKNGNNPEPWAAEIRAGGDFTLKGASDLFGGVEARGNIDIAGSFILDTGIPVSNKYALVAVPTVLSRR